jgi:hypothetical protein
MGWLKKYLKRKLKRFIVSYKLFELSIFKDKFEYTGYEKICTAIVRKMINHNDTKYTIAPLSNKRYLINKTLEIFVIMEDSKVEITNHVYHYVITLPKKEMGKLVNRYDKKVDEERIMYENQIKSQIDNTLHKIYDKINLYN